MRPRVLFQDEEVLLLNGLLLRIVWQSSSSCLRPWDRKRFFSLWKTKALECLCVLLSEQDTHSGEGGSHSSDALLSYSQCESSHLDVCRPGLETRRACNYLTYGLATHSPSPSCRSNRLLRETSSCWKRERHLLASAGFARPGEQPFSSFQRLFAAQLN